MYIKTEWVNGQKPAIDEDNLNKIERGIADAHEMLEEIIPNVLQAEDSNGAVQIGNVLIQWGLVNVDVAPTSGYQQSNVTFRKGYKYQPMVTVQTCGNYNILSTLSGNSSTGFTANTRSLAGRDIEGRWFKWVAVGICED